VVKKQILKIFLEKPLIFFPFTYYEKFLYLCELVSITVVKNRDKFNFYMRVGLWKYKCHAIVIYN